MQGCFNGNITWDSMDMEKSTVNGGFYREQIRNSMGIKSVVCYNWTITSQTAKDDIISGLPKIAHDKIIELNRIELVKPVAKDKLSIYNLLT